MLLLLVQQKLTNLIIDEAYDLNVALRMYTKRIVIQRRVEDLQLGTALHDITAGTRMEYLPMRKRSNLDKKRAPVIVQEIDKQLYQRRLMRNLEKFVGGRMDVKTTFLNDDLDEEVYMNQPLGFIMPDNENKVDITKEFFSSRFSMKDMGEADVILGIRIKHEILLWIQVRKLMPNNGHVVSQLEYSMVISCLMYTMNCTRPKITFIVGKLSRLIYTGYPLVLEGYIDASWISNTEDNSSTSGWVFLLGSGAIS
nr:hypothetical protein [Tanacetum cinerariifolium]